MDSNFIQNICVQQFYYLDVNTQFIEWDKHIDKFEIYSSFDHRNRSETNIYEMYRYENFHLNNLKTCNMMPMNVITFEWQLNPIWRIIECTRMHTHKGPCMFNAHRFSIKSPLPCLVIHICHFFSVSRAKRFKQAHKYANMFNDGSYRRKLTNISQSSTNWHYRLPCYPRCKFILKAEHFHAFVCALRRGSFYDSVDKKWATYEWSRHLIRVKLGNSYEISIRGQICVASRWCNLRLYVCQ